MSMSSEPEILEYLNTVVQRSLQRDEIRQAVERIQERLGGDRHLRIAWESVPIELYEPLPARCAPPGFLRCAPGPQVAQNVTQIVVNESCRSLDLLTCRPGMGALGYHIG